MLRISVFYLDAPASLHVGPLRPVQDMRSIELSLEESALDTFQKFLLLPTICEWTGDFEFCGEGYTRYNLPLAVFVIADDVLIQKFVEKDIHEMVSFLADDKHKDLLIINRGAECKTICTLNQREKKQTGTKPTIYKGNKLTSTAHRLYMRCQRCFGSTEEKSAWIKLTIQNLV